MLQYEGCPNEACPGKVNNSSVKLSQDDLMICKDCDNFLFPYTVAKSSTTADNRASTPLSASWEFMSISHQTTVARPTSTEKITINELLFFALNKSDTCWWHCKHRSLCLKKFLQKIIPLHLQQLRQQMSSTVKDKFIRRYPSWQHWYTDTGISLCQVSK